MILTKLYYANDVKYDMPFFKLSKLPWSTWIGRANSCRNYFGTGSRIIQIYKNSADKGRLNSCCSFFQLNYDLTGIKVCSLCPGPTETALLDVLPGNANLSNIFVMISNRSYST